MAQNNNDVHQREEGQGNSDSIAQPHGKRFKQHQAKNGIKSATDMVTQLQSLLEWQEHDFKEREAALEKQRRLLELEYPQNGKDSDVLLLNVGRSKEIAVHRRTLTHFENSMLASRFSGRCDDSLPLDPDGYIFIDQDPNVFMSLLNFLRQCDQKTRNDIAIEPPLPTAQFCSMLEYYGLMSDVYPQEWRRVWGTRKGIDMTKENTSSGCSITISNSRGLKRFMLQVQKDCPSKPVNANAFTVMVDQGSRGFIGWTSKHTNNPNKKIIDNDSDSFDSEEEASGDDEVNAFCFDLVEAKFKVDGKTRKSKGEAWSRKLPVTIICTRDAAAHNTYSIQVLENDTTTTDAMIMYTYCNDKQMFPFITFAGKVTISNVLYEVCLLMRHNISAKL